MKPLIIQCPYAETWNSILYKLIPTYFKERLGGGSIQGGYRTNWDFHHQNIKEVDDLVRWIKSLFPQIASYFAGLKKGEKCAFLIEALEITHMWGIRYNKGDRVYPHNHFPFALSFGYYIHTPKGCSPLKLENKKIKVQAGQCIFFLGHEWHSIDPDPVGGRCLIAGNILYSDTKVNQLIK